jgi:hypothetical protein
MRTPTRKRRPSAAKFANWREGLMLPDTFEAIEAGRPAPRKLDLSTGLQRPPHEQQSSPEARRRRGMLPKSQ